MENIYAKLLGLPEHIENPNYYEILTIKEGFHSEAKIEDCYKEQLQKLQELGNNPKYKDAILYIKSQLRQARSTLGNNNKKKEYDKDLIKKRVLKLRNDMKLFLVKGYIEQQEYKYLQKKCRELRIPLPELDKALAGKKIKNNKASFSVTKIFSLQFLSPRVWQVTSFFAFLVIVYLYLETTWLQQSLKAQRRLYSATNQTETNPHIETEPRNGSPSHNSTEPIKKMEDFASLPLEKENQNITPKNVEPPVKKEVEIAKPNTVLEQIQNKIKSKMAYIRPGFFFMGSDKNNDESPQRRVYLDGYYISIYEVTNREYREFVLSADYYVPYSTEKDAENFSWDPTTKEYPSGKGDHPVTLVTWEDAIAYCKWLSKRTGFNVNLPTEAQWEKAARGSEPRIYPWGDQVPNENGFYRSNFIGANDGYAESAPVGTFPDGISPFGCLDMAGNISEWCLDSYAQDAYKTLDNKNPYMPPEKTLYKIRRVLRGGSWKDLDPLFLRCTYRAIANIDQNNTAWGFRYVILPPE